MPRLTRWLLSWCLAVLAHAAVAAPAAPPIELLADREQRLDASFEWLDDPTGSLRLPEVVQAYRQGRFAPLPALNRGYTRATSWLVVTLSSTLERPQHRWLWLYPFSLDELEVFVQTGSNADNPFSYVSYALGDRQPLAVKPLRQPQTILPLYFVDLEVKRVFIRVQTTTPHFLRASLQPEPMMTEVMFQHTVLQSGYLSLVLVITVLSLLFGWRLKDPVYGWYGAYLLTLAVGYLAYEGMIGMLWPASAHLVTDHLQAAGLGLGFSCLVSFSARLFAVRRRYRVLHLGLQAAVLLGVLTFASGGTHLYGLLAELLSMLGLLVMAVLCVLAWRELRSPSSRVGGVFMAAFLSLVVCWSLSSLRGLGWLPANDWTLYGLQALTLVHMVLNAVGLSGRVLQAERRAQSEALAQARQMADEMTVELQGRTRQLEVSLANEQVAAEQQRHFVDLVTHEYRTPLAVLRTNLDILQLADPETQPVTQRRLDTLRRAVERLSTVFEEKLARAAWQADGVRVSDVDNIELHQYLARALENRRQEAASLNQPVPPLVLADGPPVWVSVDPGLLSTAVGNLLDNAIKYALGAAPIVVDVQARDAQAWLSVRNACQPGLSTDPDQYLRRGARGANVGNQPGQGLGLHIVERLCREMAGELSLHTDPAGWFEARVRWPLLKGPDDER